MSTAMKWTVHTLDLGEVELNTRRLIPNEQKRDRMVFPVQGWLLTSGDTRVVIDTGFRSPDILKRIGDAATGIESPEQRLSAQLARHGVEPQQVHYVLHTHLHIDHAGQTDLFPMSTTVVINRRELEYAVSGLSGPSYPPEDIKHLIDRLHTPGALWLLDLEGTGGEPILPGLRCVAAGGHTEGSMVVIAETEAGTVCFCGDLVYSVRHQLMSPTTLRNDVIVTSNHVVSRRSEKIALKRLMQTAPRFYLYPSHDWPVLVEEGRVTEGGERTLRATMGRCFCSIGESSP
ncbi:MAG: N-acyl homoserine lactonase family protein [Betaproteobacteria bacterium]|jgi:glyoxylase-like metal-dependent hydrolase (beta-lactamase superfamily II)|nr:N-acyl homoserine lactonase family protein [Betaproteobacteria bacterium]